MPKGGLLWRFRKISEANPIITLDCGCKYHCLDKEKILIRHGENCTIHTGKGIEYSRP